jgi:hypothetical protein
MPAAVCISCAHPCNPQLWPRRFLSLGFLHPPHHISSTFSPPSSVTCFIAIAAGLSQQLEYDRCAVDAGVVEDA